VGIAKFAWQAIHQMFYQLIRRCKEERSTDTLGILLNELGDEHHG